MDAQLEGKIKMQEAGTLLGSSARVNFNTFHLTNSILSYRVNDNTVVKLLLDLKSVVQGWNYILFAFICFVLEKDSYIRISSSNDTAALVSCPAWKCYKNVKKKMQRKEFKSQNCE